MKHKATFMQHLLLMLAGLKSAASVKKTTCFLAAMAISVLSTTFTSCCDDDNDNAKVEEYGELTITNLSAHGETVASAATMLNGDTLKVVFQPNEICRDWQFVISGSLLEKLNDSLFVAKDLKAGNNTMTLTATSTMGGSTVTGEKVIEVNRPSSYAVVPFVLQASQDLLLFTTAEITYTDAEGQQHTFTVDDKDWNRPDSTSIFVYEDQNGHQHYTHGETPEAGWTFVEELKLAPNALYTFKARYYKLGIDASFKVKYVAKSGVTATADSYYFYHTLDRSSATIEIPNGNVRDIYNSTNFDLTNHDVAKDDVPAYLATLQDTPDVFNINISANGKITKQ